jgi:ABC-type phosphate transport system permease subunit
MDAVDTLISRFGTYIINPILLVIFAGGFFMFMYGLLQFMINMNRGEDTSDGKRHMIYGTIGMFIMVSVYGIISLLDSTFGLNVANPNYNTQSVSAPNVQFVGGQ